MNTIIFELSAEDRARLDKIIELLGHVPACDHCVEGALKLIQQAPAAQTAQEPEKRAEKAEAYVEDKDITDALRAALAPEIKATAPADEHPAPVELPWEEDLKKIEAAKAEQAKTYTHDDVLAIVRRLIAPGSAKRDKAKAIVNAYAPKISQIPEDKLAEVMTQLTELEAAA